MDRGACRSAEDVGLQLADAKPTLSPKGRPAFPKATLPIPWNEFSLNGVRKRAFAAAAAYLRSTKSRVRCRFLGNFIDLTCLSLVNDKGRYHSRWNTPNRLRLFPSKDHDLATVTRQAAGVVPGGAEGLGTFLGVLPGQHPQQDHSARLLRSGHPASFVLTLKDPRDNGKFLA
jgi:hypothetical protein